MMFNDTDCFYPRLALNCGYSDRLFGAYKISRRAATGRAGRIMPFGYLTVMGVYMPASI